MIEQLQPEKYLSLVRLLAEQGNAKAQFNLGTLLLQGELPIEGQEECEKIKKNPTEAAKWFKKAAEQGITSAQHNLGTLHLKGEGVETNPVEAARWFKKAAESGDIRSQHCLGAMTFEGLGVEKNVKEAYLWLSLALANCPPKVQQEARATRDYVAAQLTPQERDDAREQVTLWQNIHLQKLR